MHPTDLEHLLASYQVLLLDAYGVLIHSEGAMPGAARLIERLEREGRTWFVLTNDASRLPETSARHYQSFGLGVRPERVITSGSLLSRYFAQHKLQGARTVVFGPQDSRRYIEQAGGVVIDPSEELDVLAICDESMPDFVDSVDSILTAVVKAIDRGKRPHLLLPNPDLIYPKGKSGFGIAAASIGEMLERALALILPRDPPRFVRLGKPHPPLFEEAERRAGTRSMILLGDQIETDIRGARGYGIDAALVTTGVSRWDPASVPEDRRPTWILSGLEGKL